MTSPNAQRVHPHDGDQLNYSASVKLLINGQWRDANAGETLPVFNPATGMEIGRVAHARISDLDLALEAAERGFKVWSRTPAFERAAKMLKAASLLRERLEAIAQLMTQEQGKPLPESKAELLGAAGVIEWAAAEATRVYGRIIEPRTLGTELRVLRKPVGPVAAFTPWNFPVNQVVRKVAAALATGNSILVKGPEETPASPAELIRAFVDAGIPAGVVGLVYGDPSEISREPIRVSRSHRSCCPRETELSVQQRPKYAPVDGQGGNVPVLIS